jgi:hypothetical protein
VKLDETDPELLRQLDDAIETGEPVQAVVKLQRTPGKPPIPEVVEEQTRKAVDRAAESTGEQPTDVHVMGRLATAYISGSEKFLREFVEQPEIASAVANQVAPPSPGPDVAEKAPAVPPGPTGSGGGSGRRSTPQRSAPRD